MKKFFSIFAAVALAACSAQIESEDTPQAESQADRFTFSFSTESVVPQDQPADQTTRTALDASMNVSWTAGDKVTVFANGTPTPFTADEGGSSTTFSGADPESATAYYALYPHNPYDIAASISDNIISTVIPNCQTGVKDGFDPLAQVMVGRSTDGVFHMKNAVALVKISIPADVTSVTLATNSGTTGLAGKTDITVGDDGVPTAVSATARSVLLVPSGETFEVGDYYIAVAPGAVAGGLKILLTKSSDDNIYSVSSDAKATFYRSKITALKNVESKLAATAVGEKVSIVFSDGSAWQDPFFWGEDDTTTNDKTTATNSISTSSASASFAATSRAFYASNGSPNTNGKCLQLEFMAAQGLWRDAAQGMCFGRDEDDYLALPYRSSARLVAVSYTPGTASCQGYAALTDQSGNPVAGGDAFQYRSTQGKRIIWHNLDAANATRYRITATGTANAIAMQRLDLYYVVDSDEATPANARTLPPEATGMTVTMNGATDRWISGDWSDYTGGFEYKAADAGWDTATVVDFGKLTTNTWSKAVTLSAGSYNYRAWVQSGAVKYYGNAHDFDLSLFPEYTPDFSRVGYHYGDREIPTIPARITLDPPADPDADSWETIQNALNTVPAPGAVLLKSGTWKVSKGLTITRSGVVLRGEGASTTIYCTSETQIPNLIQIGSITTKKLGTYSAISASYVPCGQMWVTVDDPSKFAMGDHVFIYRPATDDWLDAIHMREIPMNSSGTTVQWDSSTYKMYWDRIVTAVEGDKVYLDNPVVMGIGTPEGISGDWGSGRLYKGSWARIKESGVENLVLDTRYGSAVDEDDNYIDEDHVWSAVEVYSAQHCWITHVTSQHFGYCCINLRGGAKNITVADCHSVDPVSQIAGSRRYAFQFYNSELCLIRDCTCDKDRHQYVTGPRVPGPNVFYNCTATGTRGNAQAGPHQRWATGILWDNVNSDTRIEIQDRSQSGTGHGWTAVNSVLYNCEAPLLVCQSPWASGQNWATGCIGVKSAGTWEYKWESPLLGTRPDGVWTSTGVHVTPASMYCAQLEARHSLGIDLGGLIADDGDGSSATDSFTYDEDRNDYSF